MKQQNKLPRNTPKVIYVQIGDQVDDDLDFKDLDQEYVTWATHKCLDNDIKYFLAEPVESNVPDIKRNKTDALIVVNHIPWDKEIENKYDFEKGYPVICKAAPVESNVEQEAVPQLTPKPNEEDFTAHGKLMQPHFNIAMRAWTKLNKIETMEQSAKEKAKELIKKYEDALPYCEINAKECALITVEEIINLNGNIALFSNDEIKYWEDVKEEIKKL